MEVKVIKTDKDGNITAENTTIEGVKDFVPAENLKEFDGTLVHREEKTINLKDGKKLNQFIYNDEQDERGTQLNLETFSPTDDAILAKLMEEHKGKVHMYYEIVTNDYGTKFKIKAIQLPDGTWSVPKAKEAWKKGNMVNNRALAVQAAATVFMGTANDEKDPTEAVLKMAADFYEWIKQA